MSTAMPLVSAYGNCQAAALLSVLFEAAEFAARFEHAPLSPCFAIEPAEIETWLAASAPRLGLFLAQHLRPGWRGAAVFDTATLAAPLPASCRRLAWVDAYYRGYGPELVYPRSFPRSPLHDYVSLLAELGFAAGISAGTVAALHQDASAFAPPLVEAVHKIALHDLQAREDAAACEVRLAPFLAAHWREERLFQTFNHPLRPVFRHLAGQVCTAIGLEAAFPGTGAEPLGHWLPPSLAAFDRVLERPPGPSAFYLAGRGVDAAEYYAAWYEEFGRIGGDAIAADLRQHAESDAISHLVVTAAAQRLRAAV